MTNAASLAVGAILGRPEAAAVETTAPSLKMESSTYDNAMKDILERVKDIDISSTVTSPNESKVRQNSGDASSGVTSTDDEEEASCTSSEAEIPQISLREVGDHCSMEDAWIVFYDRVYDITNFLYEVILLNEIEARPTFKKASSDFHTLLLTCQLHVVLPVFRVHQDIKNSKASFIFVLKS